MMKYTKIVLHKFIAIMMDLQNCLLVTIWWHGLKVLYFVTQVDWCSIYDILLVPEKGMSIFWNSIPTVPHVSTLK